MSTHLCVLVERGNAEGLPVGFGVQLDSVHPFYELLVCGEPVQLSRFSRLPGRRRRPGEVRGKEGLPHTDVCVHVVVIDMCVCMCVTRMHLCIFFYQLSQGGGHFCVCGKMARNSQELYIQLIVEFCLMRIKYSKSLNPGMWGPPIILVLWG